MLHANIVLDNRGYKQTLGMCNIFCLFLLDNCSRTQLSVRLYVYCLSCTEYSIRTCSPYLKKAHVTYKNTRSLARWCHADVNEDVFSMLSFTLPSVLALILLGFRFEDTRQFRN